jgi:hypothetical protein
VGIDAAELQSTISPGMIGWGATEYEVRVKNLGTIGMVSGWGICSRLAWCGGQKYQLSQEVIVKGKPCRCDPLLYGYG